MNTSLQRLESTLKLEMQSVTRAFNGMNWADPTHYGQWLWQTHYFVCHSTRLLALAASRMSSQQQNLHMRFLSHASEEKGHETLALKDYQGLLKAGFDLPAHYEESEATQLFYQSQYYWIEHREPTSFFGYILLLEMAAAQIGPELYRRALQSFGGDCTRFLKVHAEEDPDHIIKAMKSLCELPEASIELVIQNLRVSSWSYQSICREIQKAGNSPLQLVA